MSTLIDSPLPALLTSSSTTTTSKLNSAKNLDPRTSLTPKRLSSSHTSHALSLIDMNTAYEFETLNDTSQTSQVYENTVADDVATRSTLPFEHAFRKARPERAQALFSGRHNNESTNPTMETVSSSTNRPKTSSELISDDMLNSTGTIKIIPSENFSDDDGESGVKAGRSENEELDSKAATAFRLLTDDPTEARQIRKQRPSEKKHESNSHADSALPSPSSRLSSVILLPPPINSSVIPQPGDSAEVEEGSGAAAIAVEESRGSTIEESRREQSIFAAPAVSSSPASSAPLSSSKPTSGRSSPDQSTRSGESPDLGSSPAVIVATSATPDDSLIPSTSLPSSFAKSKKTIKTLDDNTNGDRQPQASTSSHDNKDLKSSLLFHSLIGSPAPTTTSFNPSSSSARRFASSPSTASSIQYHRQVGGDHSPSPSSSSSPTVYRSLSTRSSHMRGASNPTMSSSNNLAGSGTTTASTSNQIAILPSSPAPLAATTSRYLLTVIPPDHIPHDPPHPRTSPHCSGYGPPQHFKRGTLVPLYPTLSSQLAAIAREYGLPSTGGLVLYLLSTIDPFSATPNPLPGSAGLTGEGGPRIGEEAWSLLWARLFEEEEELGMMMHGQDTDDDEDDYAPPPVPPIPIGHRDYSGSSTVKNGLGHESLDQTLMRNRNKNASISTTADNRLLSDEDAAVAASELGEADHGRTSYSSDAGEHDESVYSTSAGGRGPGGSSGVGSVTTGPSSVRRSSSTNRSGTSIGRGHPTSSANVVSPAGHRFSSNASMQHRIGTSYGSQLNLRRASHHSASSRMYGASGRNTSHGSYMSSGSASSAAVVVGKVEFDIDRRKGGRSKWYETWIAGASPMASLATTPNPATSTGPGTESEASSSLPGRSDRRGDESSRSSLGPSSLPPSTLASPAPAMTAFAAPSSSTQALSEEASIPAEVDAIGSRGLESTAMKKSRSGHLKPLELGGLGIAAGLIGGYGALKAVQHIDGSENGSQQEDHDQAITSPISLDPRAGLASTRSSVLAPSAASGYSLAAMAGHSDDEDETLDHQVGHQQQEQERHQEVQQPEEDATSAYAPSEAARHSIVSTSERKSPQLNSHVEPQRSSYASSTGNNSVDSDTGDHAYMNLADDPLTDDDEHDEDRTSGDIATQHHSYRHLDDESVEAPTSSINHTRSEAQDDQPKEDDLKENRQTLESDTSSFASPMNDESQSSSQPNRHSRIDSDTSAYADSDVDPVIASRSVNTDPLGDVFPNDEQTWRSIAASEDEPVSTKGMVETTGLGIHDTKIADLEMNAPEGVVENREVQEVALEDEVLPPQNDVADVMTMLKSGQEQNKSNLASPIHLDSSPSAPETTGVFATPVHHDDHNEDRDEIRDSFDSEYSQPVARENQPSIDVRPPSTVHSSPEYLPQRKQRQGWADIPPVVDRSMSNSSSMASISSGIELDDTQRESTIGLMENLDDLERALADLSPSTSRSRGQTSPSLSAQQDATPIGSPVSAISPASLNENVIPPLSETIEAVPPPAASPIVENRAAEPEAQAEELAPPPPRTISPPLPSPTLSGRPMFRYGQSSASIVSDSNNGRAIIPPRKASLGAELSSKAGDDEELLPPSPRLFDSMPGSPTSRNTPNEPQAFSSPQQINSATEMPELTRTPRSTSLRNNAEPSPRQFPLPPSPMPQPRLSEDGPSNYGSMIAGQRAAPPIPPIPEPVAAPTASTSTSSETESLPSRSPRSSIKSIRTSKPWNSSKDSKSSNKSGPESAPVDSGMDSQQQAQASTGGKSPTFFAKSTFSKFNLFGNKNKGTSDNGPENVASPPLSSGQWTESTREEASAGLTAPTSNVEPTATPTPILPSALPAQDINAMRAELFSTSPKPPTSESRSPRIVEHPPSLYEAPPVAATTEERKQTFSPRLDAEPSDSLRPSVPAFGLASSLRPARSYDSFHTATSAGSDITVTGRERAATSDLTTVLPPLPFDSETAIRSPISDYAPDTAVREVVSPMQYPASAPTTPGNWKTGEGKPRPNAAARFSRARPRHQLTADIDQLLSQMNEIDFGDEDSMMNGGGSEDDGHSSSNGSTMNKASPSIVHSAFDHSMDESTLAVVETLNTDSHPSTPRKEDWPPIPPMPADMEPSSTPGDRSTVALSSLGGLMTMSSP